MFPESFVVLIKKIHVENTIGLDNKILSSTPGSDDRFIKFGLISLTVFKLAISRYSFALFFKNSDV